MSLAGIIKDIYSQLLGGTSPGKTADAAGDLAEQIQYIVDNTGGGGATVLVKEADESVSSSTALQDDDEILFPVAANEVWQFEGVLIIEASYTPSIKLTFTGPSGAVGSYAVNFIADPGGQGHGGQLGDSTAYFDSGTEHRLYYFYGGIHNGANAGNLQLRWAQVSSDAAATVIRAGSYIKYQQGS